MKNFYKQLFTYSWLLLSCTVTQAMNTENSEEKAPESFEVDNISTKIIEEFWEDKDAVRGMRDVMLDVCMELAKFYQWTFCPYHLVISNNELAKALHRFLLQTRAVMAGVYKEQPAEHPLFLENDKFWNKNVDLDDDALKAFAGQHSVTELANEALVRIFTLRHYLGMICHKTEHYLVRKVTQEALTLSNNVVLMLNQYTDKNFIKRHRQQEPTEKKEDSTEDQDAF